MRLIEARGARRYVVVLLVACIPLISLTGLFGGWAGWNDPKLTWRGYANYEFTKYANVAVIVISLWVIAWFLMHLLLSTGRLGLVYGFTRGGNAYLGSWFGMAGLPWRRVKCVKRVKVVLRPAQPSPSQSRWILDHHWVVVTSGRRTRKMRALAPLDPTSGPRVRRWLEEQGLKATVVDPLSGQ